MTIRSEACNDRDRKGRACGWAFIWVNGRDYSQHRRGYNVVVFKMSTGESLAFVSFYMLPV